MRLNRAKQARLDQNIVTRDDYHIQPTTRNIGLTAYTQQEEQPARNRRIR